MLARLTLPLAVILALLALPFAAFAQESAAQAGFAPGSLWLSKTSAVEGESLTVYTVVHNSGSGTIAGDVRFLVDDAELAVQHFELEAGASEILAALWEAAPGAHTFSARLEDVSGAAAASVRTEASAITIAVAPAPPSAVEIATAKASGFLASTSPAVQNALQSVAGVAERFREAGERYLADALYDATSTRASAAPAQSPEAEGGQVLGEEIAPAPAAEDGPSVFGSIKEWVLRALLSVFSSTILFYVALLVVCYVLYKIVRAIFRERSRY
jgi:hypothetical protein